MLIVSFLFCINFLAALVPASPVILPPISPFIYGHTPAKPVAIGWSDPRINGGQLLDFTTPLLGEPLNVIISGLSDPYILTEAGLHEYAKSIGFSEECLGLHYGDRHDADLGDGEGRKTEQFLARQYYFPIWGTCWESLAGGDHFRAWKQNGTVANSGAWFLGVSKEGNSRRHHKIVPNGYNIGRDWLVDHAVSGSKWHNNWWKAEVEWHTDLLSPGSDGVNHGIPQDGRVAILTVHLMDTAMCSYSRLLLRNALAASGLTSPSLAIEICPVPQSADSFLDSIDPRTAYGVVFPFWIWLWYRVKVVVRWIATVRRRRIVTQLPNYGTCGAS